VSLLSELGQLVDLGLCWRLDRDLYNVHAGLHAVGVEA
jgi:hypothetical protein